MRASVSLEVGCFAGRFGERVNDGGHRFVDVDAHVVAAYFVGKLLSTISEIKCFLFLKMGQSWPLIFALFTCQI